MRRTAFPRIFAAIIGLLATLLFSFSPEKPRRRTSFNIGFLFAQIDDDKAGFWKCPYHNSRMCLGIIERYKVQGARYKGVGSRQ